MNWRRIFAVASTAAVMCIAVGCSGPAKDSAEPAASPSVSNGPTITATDRSTANRRLRELRSAVKASDSFSAKGVVTAKGSQQISTMVFDRRHDSFRGSIRVQSAQSSLAFTIVRASKLTWLKAPELYWQKLGYDSAPAKNKFVVFQPDAGSKISDPYNYNAVVQAVIDSPASEVSAPALVRHDKTEYFQFRLSTAGTTTLLELPRSPDLRRTRVISGQTGADAVITLTQLRQQVEVSPPSAAEVVRAKDKD